MDNLEKELGALMIASKKNNLFRILRVLSDGEMTVREVSDSANVSIPNVYYTIYNLSRLCRNSGLPPIILRKTIVEKYESKRATIRINPEVRATVLRMVRE